MLNKRKIQLHAEEEPKRREYMEFRKAAFTKKKSRL